MKFKSITIFLVISSFFLTCILSIWKIMSTLQGLNFTNLNITGVFFNEIILSLLFVLIGNRINHLIKVFSLSLLFSFSYFYFNETSPYWYIFGVFLIILFFTNKLKKYNTKSLTEDFISEKIIFDFITLFVIVFFDGYLIQKLPLWYNVGVFCILYFFTTKISKYNFTSLKEEHSTQLILFDFLTLFGILFFSFVILFPFYMMLITSFKTQIALLVNPLDFSINFGQDLKNSDKLLEKSRLKSSGLTNKAI